MSLKNHQQRLWIIQLYREYAHICSNRRLKLRPAVLHIAPLAQHWALWQPQQQLITLHEQLLTQHPWPLVVEILRHEMAHQYADEHLSRGTQGPHGPAFQQACVVLGVPGWARQATLALAQPLRTWRDHAPSSEAQRMLDKVEKLLALAGSSNEHEAMLAMQRAREIYQRHNLAQTLGGEPENMVSHTFETKRLRLSSLDTAIFALLRGHFAVRPIYTKSFNSEDLRSYQAVEIMGRRDNVLMAEHVYHFLQQQVSRLWQAYQKRGASGLKAKNSYQLGIIAGFARQLERTSPAATAASAAAALQISTQTALQLVQQASSQLDDYVEQRYPDLVTRRTAWQAPDAKFYGAGQQAGEDLRLYKPIAATHGNRGRLLRGG